MKGNVGPLTLPSPRKRGEGKKAQPIFPNRHFLLFALLISILLSTPSIALEKTVLPDPVTSGKDVIPRFYWMEDPARTLTINDVADEKYNGRFALSNRDSLGLGLSSSAFWVRFTVVNSSTKTASWILENDHPLWDFVEFYARDENGAWTTKRAGDHVPFAEREIAYRKSTFHAIIPPGAERTFFLRFYGEIMQSVKIKITLWPEEAFHNGNTTEYIVLGLYFGAMAVMFFYNLFLYFAIGDRRYLWYVLYVLGISLSMFAYNGLAFQYLWPTSFYLGDFASILFGYIAYVFIAFFSRSFLETRRHTPWLDLLFLLIAAAALAGVVFCLLGWMVIAMRMIYLIIVASSIVGLIAAFIRFTQGYRPARFYLLSWSAVGVGMLSLSLKDMGFLPYNTLTLWAPQIGTWLDVVLLSFALADRINFLSAEREHAREEAARTGERLQAVMDNTLAVIYMKDPEGRYLTVNRQFEKLFGVTLNEITGKTDFDMFPKEAAETFRSNDQMAFKAGEPLELEETVPQTDGPHVYISIKFPLRDGAGKIYAICGISTDITERKRVEAEITSTRNQLQATLDAIPDLLFELGLDGRYYDYHSPHAELLAAPPEVLLGKLVPEILPPDSSDIVLSALREAHENGQSFGKQFELELPQGKLWFELSVTRKTVPGQEPRFIVLSRDITERKKAEEELKKFFNLVPDMVCIASTEGYFLKINPIWEAMLGYTEQEILATPFLDFIHPDDREATVKEVERQIAGEPTIEFINRYRCKDGSYKWLEWMATPAVDRKLLFAAARDITERKKAEEFLKTSYEKLEVLVKERTAELEKAKSKAEEATRLKGQFILLVSHDIRSPLSSIIMVLKTMMDDMLEPLPAHHKRLTDKAYNVAVRLVGMIQKVLDISRIQTGALQIKPTSFEAASFLSYSLVSVLPRAEDKRISIKTEAPSGLKIHVDADIFSQVLQNLVGNAIKFTHPGGAVTVSVAENGLWNTITVRDTGVGISETGFSNLFKQGVEFSALGTAGEKGTGLGLLLCKEIVEAHGGRIEVESRVGEGSSFHVFLPAGKFTVLLVDDQQAAREIAKGYLKKMGMNILEAADGREAMRLIEEMIPDVVITDIAMPIMNGLELLETIRSGEGTKSIPVIVMTSNRDPDSQRRAIELGADGFVMKPISENDLLPIVEKIIQRAKPL